jgi:tetratricopeptide (TPR) repeat protein
MVRALRFALVMLAFVAAAPSWPRAQGGTAQKPPDPKPAAVDAQKPAEPAQELPDDAKAFNAAAGEKNPIERVEALEKFIADNPNASPMLLSSARSQISSSVLAAFKDSRAKYLAQAEKEIADAAKRADSAPAYSTYNRLASALLNAGVFSEEAEDFARKGLAAMDERAYMETRKKQYERSLAAYEKTTASAAQQKPAAAADGPAAPAADAPAAPPAPNYRIAMKDGVMQASLAPPRPPRPATPSRPPVQPKMPTEDEMRASFNSDRASAQATLGQILMKRGRAEEGERVLTEAYAAKPASSTMAAIARVLADSAKKAGNEPLQLEYLTVLALSGRITADETKDFEAAYRKTHNGSLDGLDTMLDERYRREHVRFAVTPFTRTPPAKPTGRTVLAEVFPGAG